MISDMFWDIYSDSRYMPSITDKIRIMYMMSAMYKKDDGWIKYPQICESEDLYYCTLG